MSQAQLNKLLTDNERLRGQIDRSANIMTTSAASQDLMAWILAKPDPLLPTYLGENIYHRKEKDTSVCSVI